MNKFFENCTTLDELKKAYKKAAMKYHPDMGGDTSTMQRINAEYEATFEILKRTHNAKAAEDTTGKTYATAEEAKDFIFIIDHLLKLDGIEIELCGRWLWLSGETLKHKEELKACGCKWSAGKKMWYWHFKEDGERWHRGKRSMEYIRSKYGSTSFKKNYADAEALPA